MSKKVPTLDKTRPYGIVRVSSKGNHRIKYSQDRMHFDAYGDFIADMQNQRKPARQAVEAPAAKSGSELRAEALARAATKLDAGSVPLSLKTAAKENAKALAAEGNA